ncbi:MAG: glycosyltransferase [Candidatus Levyibacteriota bacterium]
MKKYFFSVVIPTLNEENYLPNILHDLTRQTEKNFEVIVVNGPSKDKTSQKAMEFATILPIRLFQIKKGNVSMQRNLGAKKAQGRYLIFLDADCRVYPSFIKKLKENIRKQPGLLFIPTLIPDDKTAKNALIFKIINFIVDASQSFDKPWSAGGSIFVEKTLFSLTGGFNEQTKLAEDHGLIQKVRVWGVKAKVLKDTKIIFSLRRVRKEGQFVLLYKYLLASVQFIISGETKTSIIAYEMGGDRYDMRKEKLAKKYQTQKINRIMQTVSSFLN